MPAAILHLLGSAQPEGSGIARIVATLAAGLDPVKYQVHAWFLGPSGPLVEELQTAGATVRSMNWWGGARDPHDLPVHAPLSSLPSVKPIARFRMKRE